MSEPYLLLVDADSEYADEMETVLVGAGITVVAASSHSHALRLAKLQAPELLLLDLDKPPRDSVRLLNDIGRLKLDVPLMWTTGEVTEDAVKRVRDSGAAGLLPRDADTVTVVCALRAVMAGDRYFPPRYSRPTSPAEHANAESRRIIKLLHPFEQADEG